MDAFSAFWASAVSIVWGLPLVIAITGAGIYFTIISRCVPYSALGHTLHILRGRYDDPSKPGEVSHFRALTSALAGTIGLGNIAGVAIAVGIGGAGAVFWMWVAALCGMATKFFTCTLSCMYRRTDADGIAQGGPMYFIEVGLGPKFRPLAIMFASCGTIGALPLFQSNQLATLLHTQWNFPALATGLVAMTLVALVEIGGIRRIGAVAARGVPAMCLLYIAACLWVILSHLPAVPRVFADIFLQAFGFEGVAGGAAGIALREVIITGVKRATFSNEAGIGTEEMAHGAARTDEPVREGLVAMLGPVIDTHVICTMTALVILTSGVQAGPEGVAMVVTAFEETIPVIGRPILSAVLVMFAVSTMITYAYYSTKCATYLFGRRIGRASVYIYIALIPVAAMWAQDTAVNIIDTAFALMAIPTLTATLLLSPRVVAALGDYLRRTSHGRPR
jgi:AGCS family alanine or glycine:cation symporter